MENYESIESIFYMFNCHFWIGYRDSLVLVCKSQNSLPKSGKSIGFSER
jgi:hypothetical protein